MSALQVGNYGQASFFHFQSKNFGFQIRFLFENCFFAKVFTISWAGLPRAGFPPGWTPPGLEPSGLDSLEPLMTMISQGFESGGLLLTSY